MRSGFTWLRRLARDARGDVLLEYVLLTFFIAVPLIWGQRGLFNMIGVPDFGLVGDAFSTLYRSIITGLSAPVP